MPRAGAVGYDGRHGQPSSATPPPEIRQIVRVLSRCTRERMSPYDHRELGAPSRIAAAAGGPLLYLSARHEARRHPSGRHLEPRTFVERTNWT
jgi:hypothetical protein